MSPMNGRLPEQPPPHFRRRALWVVLGLLGAGCVYDDDEPCGPGKVRWEDASHCVCAEGTAYTPEGCVTCGEHALPTPNGCVCEAGYARTLPTDPCVEVPADIGTACTTDADCPSAAYPHCQVTTFSNYCTVQNCTSDADCSAGYACNQTGTPSYCQRPPVGAGRTCASDADCAVDSEALFCDAFFTFTCLVRDCTVAPNNCFTGLECCANGPPVPICIPIGACLQP